MIRQSELDQKAGRWICDNTGMWTRDGLAYFSASGEEVPAATIHYLSYLDGLQSFTTGYQIIYLRLAGCAEDPNGGERAAINTTLGGAL